MTVHGCHVIAPGAGSLRVCETQAPIAIKLALDVRIFSLKQLDVHWRIGTYRNI